MTRSIAATAIVVGILVCSIGRSRAAAPLDEMVVPRYDAKGEMFRPEGYQSWVFVGTSLGLRYPNAGEPEDAGPGSFHNIYIQPQAYRHYLETGKFPEKTILVMEIFSAGTREPRSGLTRGFFEDEFERLSAAVKDADQFPDGWGYLSFGTTDEGLKSKAAPFSKEQCYDCHHEHGATDNVFTQFYPVLRH